MPCFIHADLDAFYASVEQLDYSEYRGKPIIVGGLPGDRRSVVSTASCEARVFGVHSAMPVAEAVRLCPLLDYFLPVIKLVDKIRGGSKVRKVYDKPASPYRRLLASPDLSDAVKAELTRRYERYNPVLLQQEVHRAVDALMEQNRQKALMRHQSLATA
ncbi:MAG: hypothetical protein LBD47_03410, partial [Treponema sp.]|nr:hypothetical protein [Treponema sp.]